jgi:hypothetical protein
LVRWWTGFASQAYQLFLVDLAVAAYTFNQTERQDLILSLGGCDDQGASTLSSVVVSAAAESKDLSVAFPIALTQG